MTLYVSNSWARPAARAVKNHYENNIEMYADNRVLGYTASNVLLNFRREITHFGELGTRTSRYLDSFPYRLDYTDDESFKNEPHIPAVWHYSGIGVVIPVCPICTRSHYLPDVTSLTARITLPCSDYEFSYAQDINSGPVPSDYWGATTWLWLRSSGHRVPLQDLFAENTEYIRLVPGVWRPDLQQFYYASDSIAGWDYQAGIGYYTVADAKRVDSWNSQEISDPTNRNIIAMTYGQKITVGDYQSYGF